MPIAISTFPSMKSGLTMRSQKSARSLADHRHEYAERTMMRNGMDYVSAHTFFGSRIEIIQRGLLFSLADRHPGKTILIHAAPPPQRCHGLSSPPGLESHLARRCKTSRTGTNPQDIVTAARNMGFFAMEKRHMSANSVKRFVRSGIPVIANYQSSPEYGEGHYAVIIGFNRSHFVLSDPASDRGYEQVP